MVCHAYILYMLHCRNVLVFKSFNKKWETLVLIPRNAIVNVWFQFTHELHYFLKKIALPTVKLQNVFYMQKCKYSIEDEDIFV